MPSPLTRPRARQTGHSDHGTVTKVVGSLCWWHSDTTGTERGPALLPTGVLVGSDHTHPDSGSAAVASPVVLTPAVGDRVAVTLVDLGEKAIGYATTYGAEG